MPIRNFFPKKEKNFDNFLIFWVYKCHDFNDIEAYYVAETPSSLLFSLFFSSLVLSFYESWTSSGEVYI
jgi:hypothetical protein